MVDPITAALVSEESSALMALPMTLSVSGIFPDLTAVPDGVKQKNRPLAVKRRPKSSFEGERGMSNPFRQRVSKLRRGESRRPKANKKKAAQVRPYKFVRGRNGLLP